MRKVLNVYALLTEHHRIDVEHRAAFGIIIRSGYSLTSEIAVFFKNVHHLSKLLSVLEQLTTAELVKIVLPYLRDVLGTYFCDNTLRLQGLIIGIT